MNAQRFGELMATLVIVALVAFAGGSVIWAKWLY